MTMREWARTLRDRLLAAKSPSWASGAALVLLVVVGYAFGLPLLVELEGRTSDWQWAHGRLDPPPGSDTIVHLDIDDSSLKTVGRWPWPRGRLADAVEMIDRLGADVIVLDVLLIDPSRDPAEDDKLARVLKECRAKTVLAIHATEETRLDAVWRTAEGRRRWKELRAALRGDITLEPRELGERAGLDGAYAAHVREFSLALKEIVVQEVATELRRRGTLSLDVLEAELLPAEKRATLRRFAEQTLLRAAVRQEHAEAVLESRLPKAVPGHEYVEARDVIPPLPAFAEAVSAIGVSNANQDEDGQLRRVLLRWERRGYVYPQLGVAAAATYLDLPADRLAQAPFSVLEAEQPFAVATEELLLSWPRIDPAKPIHGLARHVSLGRLLAVRDEEREIVAPMEERYVEITRALLRDNLPDVAFEAGDLADPKRRAELEAEIEGELEWRAADIENLEQIANEAEEADEPGDKAYVRLLRALKAWNLRRHELARARRILADARATLRATLKDKLAFIGWSATGNFGDFYATAAHKRTPGVVAHGVTASAILGGYVFRDAPLWVGIIATGLLGLVAAFVTDRLDPFVSFVVVLLLGAGVFAFSTLVVFAKWRVVAATATPMAAIVLGWAGTLLLRTVKVMREKAQMKRQFGARISRRLFDYLLQHPDQISLEGLEREVTCFFSDLAGFTSISERLDSRETVALLNKYMYAMNDELTKLSAYVNKFLGDGIMAVWGCFSTEPTHAELGCRAAIRCAGRLEELNASPDFEGLPRLRMRIGIATGVVTVGDCGAPPDLRDYTVIGDTANLAARLESANKQFGTGILINARTRELIPDDILCRPIGNIAVVGQHKATAVYELVAETARATPEQRDLVEATTRAVDLFREGRIEESRFAWHALVEHHGESPLADLYLAEIDRLVAAGDEAEADGVLRLTQK